MKKESRGIYIMNFNQKLDLLMSLGKETGTLQEADIMRYFDAKILPLHRILIFIKTT